jgi:hypothetical protein
MDERPGQLSGFTKLRQQTGPTLMDFIAPQAANAGLGNTLFALAVIAIIVAVLTPIIAPKDGSTVDSYLFALFVVSSFSVVGFVIAGAYFAGPDRDASETKGSIEKSYGVALSEEEFEELEYPYGKPETTIETFGSFEQTAETDDGRLVKQELTLVWKDGKMLLAKTVAGGELEPLPLKR